MKRWVPIALLLLSLLVGSAAAQSATLPAETVPSTSHFMDGVKSAIQRYLGRPYVWGSSGLKSFDCSGFVWRIMFDNGVLLKRTTARKFYMILKPAAKAEQGNFGTLVFFDDLKHVGIIDTPQSFYQAQVSLGTNHSEMNSFWKRKIYGFRQFPVPVN